LLQESLDSSLSGNGSPKLVSGNPLTNFIDILKQQGHFFDLNTLAFSGDGSYIATGGDDGKIKLWTTKNHLSFATFADHTS
jgi:WD40 repeat protein